MWKVSLILLFCLVWNIECYVQQNKPVILGYYPSWECGLPPEKINYNLFTHICHAFVTLDSEGNLSFKGNLPSSELTKNAHLNKVKVLISLGGMNSGIYFNKVMKKKEYIDKFVNSVVRMVKDYNYDGVDIDWEFPKNEQDAKNFVLLTKTLKNFFHREKPDGILTSAVPHSDWTKYYNDELKDLLDFVNVMTYDMHGPWSGHSGHNAPLYKSQQDKFDGEQKNFPAAMSVWTKTKNWPKEKLVVGIPCYGRGFRATKMFVECHGKPKYEYIGYKKIVELLKQGWERKWDKECLVPYLTKDGVKEIISYDDKESIKLKSQWAKKQGFRGIFFWEISQDYIDGKNELISIAREEFLNK